MKKTLYIRELRVHEKIFFFSAVLFDEKKTEIATLITMNFTFNGEWKL